MPHVFKEASLHPWFEWSSTCGESVVSPQFRVKCSKILKASQKKTLTFTFISQISFPVLSFSNFLTYYLSKINLVFLSVVFFSCYSLILRFYKSTSLSLCDFSNFFFKESFWLLDLLSNFSCSMFVSLRVLTFCLINEVISFSFSLRVEPRFCCFI